MLYLILIFIFLVAYSISPKYLKVFLLMLNIIIPDPIPFIDEAIMIALLLKN